MSNNGDKHYPDEPKGQVLALASQGFAGTAIAERLDLPARTVQRWIARWREISPEEEYPEVHNDWYRLTRRAQDNLHTALDQMEEEGSQLKHYSQISLQAGLGTDKITKSREVAQPQTQNVAIIVVNAARPDVIDGEVVDETP
jgi:transposase-like protein